MEEDRNEQNNKSYDCTINNESIKILLGFLEREAELNMDSNNQQLRKQSSYILHSAISTRIEIINQEILVENRKLKRKDMLSKQFSEAIKRKIKKLYQSIFKMKQLYLYCYILDRKQNLLHKDLIKFLQYTPTNSNFAKQVQYYLLQPTVFQFLFHIYSQTYNINIFISDIIDFIILKNKYQLKHECFSVQSKKLNQKYKNLFKYSNETQDINHLKNSNISFKQLADLNQKYSLLNQKITQLYINLTYLNTYKSNKQINRNSFTQLKTHFLEEKIYQKYQNLQSIIHKIKKIKLDSEQFDYHNTFGQTKTYQFSLIKKKKRLSFEDKQTFQYFHSKQNRLMNYEIQSNFKKLLLQIFQISKQNQSLLKSQKIIEDFKQKDFQFLGKKIIKVQILHNLNRILSSFNLTSHILNLINLSPNFSQYKFILMSSIISQQVEQIFQQIKIQNNDIAQDSYMIEDDGLGGWIILNNVELLIYPSAIYRLIIFLRYLMNLSRILQKKGIYSQEIILSIIISKAQQCCRWGSIYEKIYQIIRLKQTQCFGLLRKFILVTTMSDKIPEIKNITQIQNIQQIKQLYSTQLIKANYISQIIYQLDQKYSIYTVLNKIVQIQENNFITFYFEPTILLYEQILNQIINTRNNLKLDHCYSITQIHDIFAFFTNKVETFQALISSISKICQSNLQITSLLRFFHSQLSLKRTLFKGQLYWNLIYSQQYLKKQDIIQSNSQRFKQFIESNYKAFQNFDNQDINIFMSSIQQFERSSNFFQNEVNRLIIIHQIISIMKNIQNIYQNEQQLAQTFTISDQIDTPLLKIKNTKKISISYQNFPQVKEQFLKLNYSTLYMILTTIKPYNIIEQLLLQKSHRQSFANKLLLILQNQSYITIETLLNQYSNILPLKALLADLIWLEYTIPTFIEQINCIKLFEQIQKKCFTIDKFLKFQMIRDSKLMILDYKQYVNEDDIGKIKQAILIRQYIIMLGLIENYQKQQIQEVDKDIIKKILKSFYIYEIMEQIQKLSKQSHKIHILQQGKNEDDYKNNQIIVDLKIIALLKFFLQSIQNRNFQKSFRTFNLSQNICLLARLDNIVCLKINQSIKKIQRQLQIFKFSIYDSNNNVFTQKNTDFEKKNINSKKIQSINDKYLKNQPIKILKNKIKQHFWFHIKKFNKNLQKYKNLSEALSNLQKKNKKGLEKSISSLSLQISQNSMDKISKKKIYIFQQFRGFQIYLNTQQQRNFWKQYFKNYVSGFKRIDKRPFKKPFTAFSMQIQDYNILTSINNKIKVSNIIQTLPIRKLISNLQLSNKLMRDQIIWQTCKQGHSVISKINAFIAQSNQDQQQSYTNFKHAVNLQITKGMANVIKEQTQMYLQNHQYKIGKQKLKKKNIKIDSNFLTQIQDQDNKNQDRLLRINVDHIINHMKKIKIFSAWKQCLKNNGVINKQYQKFNYNVNRILNDQINLEKIKNIDRIRQNSFKQKNICNILKQENKYLNSKIKILKLSQLEKKVLNYRITEKFKY